MAWKYSPRTARRRLAVEALEARDVPAFTLQLLHAADLEAGLNSRVDAPNFAAVVDKLDDAFADTLILSSGDNYIPGPFFNAGGDPSLAAVLGGAGTPSVGRPNIEVMNRIGFQASALGNHELDAGPREARNVIAAAGNWKGAQFPYLSANVTFGAPNDLAAIQTADPDAANTAVRGRLAPSAVITTASGERVGVVGATTPLLASISSPGAGAAIQPGTNSMPALAAVLQPVIDDVRNGADDTPGTADDVTKIVLVSHLQDINNEIALIPLLTGVDVSISGGSSTRLSDGLDVLRPGDVSEGAYPIVTAGADGAPAVIVSTDEQFRYVGRLVATFDDAGVLVPDPDGAGPLTVGGIDPAVSGAFATDQAGVDRVYGTTGTVASAVSTKAAAVKEVTDAVFAVIDSKDGTVFGKTDVYLNGLRAEVRTQETNLGNLTADANLAAARAAGQPTTAVSLKNGGGIRDSIGSVASGTGARRRTAANPAAGKEAGEVSQLDVENSLRFNNSLTVLSVTAANLKRVIEHSVAASGGTATPGQFPQVGGLAFSYDLSRQAIAFDTRNAAAGGTGALVTEGDRVRNLAVKDDAGNVLDVIVKDGVVQGDPDRPVRLVTLTFLANAAANPGLGGDNYPLPLYTIPGSRVDLGVGEQAALTGYLAANYAAQPFRAADTPPVNDRRIQNVAARADTVLEPAYVVPTAPGVATEVIATVGDSLPGLNGPAPYRPIGIMDGMGAYDNGDGTFTLLMNHEIPVGVANAVGGVGTASPAGLLRDHGNAGAVVSKWIINKSDLSVVKAGDFLPNAASIFLSNNNPTAGTLHSGFLAGATTVISRLCSADLAEPGAYAWTDPGTGITYGTAARLFQSGEESGGIVNGFTAGSAGDLGPEGVVHFGRQFAFVATDDPGIAGDQSRTAYELPHAGLFAWENNLASPFAQRKTIVAGMDDSTGGQVYFWVGDKQTTGNVVERAGLTRQSAADSLYVLRVTNLVPDATGATNELRETPLGGRFTLENEGDVSGLTFAGLEALSDAKGGTQFLRPEDGAWDPTRPTDYYFLTTDRYDQVKDGVGTQVGRSRLYRLRFDDITNPAAGGTIEAVLDGTEAGNMFDNMTIDRKGRVVIQEDPGNQARSARVWVYETGTDRLVEVARHNPALFGQVAGGVVTPATAPFTQDEESSGVIDVSDILGPNKFLIDVQAHYNPGDPELVEGGQLLALTLPDVVAVGGVRVDDGTAQRSVVRSLTVTVNGEVAAAGAGAFTLTREGAAVSGVAVGAPVFANGATTFTLTFAGGGSLADGRYRLVIDGAKLITPSGQSVDADGDGAAGGTRAVTFFRLFGDADGNGAVDGKDVSRARRVFANPAANAASVYLFDADGNGVLDGADQAAFRANQGKKIRK